MDAKDALAAANKKLAEFQKAIHNKKSVSLKTCQDILDELKLLLIRFQLVPPFTGDPATISQQLHLARETLELAVLLSMKQEDYKSFERHFAQLKPYYTDYGHLIQAGESERHWLLIGLNLLGLLAHNRIAEFHTELELIPPEMRENFHISYIMELEQKMMEGAYSKVISAKKRQPNAYYAYFVEMLLKTVKEKICEISEKAYFEVPMAEAPSVFMVDEKDVLALVEKHKWDIRQDTIHFPHQTDGDLTIPAHRLLQQTLQYATELERII